MVSPKFVSVSRWLNGKIIATIAVHSIARREPETIQEITKETKVWRGGLDGHSNFSNKVRARGVSGDIAIDTTNNWNALVVPPANFTNN